ncbi:MAG: protease modulator HflC [Pseudomonadota bacterium]
MGNRAGIFLATIALVIATIWGSIFVVNEREQAIVLRFGEIVRVEDQPGLNFKLPFGIFGADTVLKIEDRLLRFDLDDIRVQVSGGKFYEVDAFMTYEIEDPKKFRQQVGASIAQAETRLRSRLDAALRQTYGRRGFEAALSEERSAMMFEVRDQMRPEAENLGIKVVDVRVRRTDLTSEVSDQTFQRMSAERLAEAERIRARGQEAARRIRASADRQVVEIKADAQREAEILRGEGEGERNRIFAEAYNKDPEFFAFYRSMQAYKEALEDAGTTMVLSPNSEFFKFFQDAQGQPGIRSSATPSASN